MIDASKLPRLPAEQLQKQQPAGGYARAPEGPASAPVRPAASQRIDR